MWFNATNVPLEKIFRVGLKTLCQYDLTYPRRLTATTTTSNQTATNWSVLVCKDAKINIL